VDPNPGRQAPVKDDANRVLESAYEVKKDHHSAFGEEMAFKNVVSELLDIIYWHARLKIAFVRFLTLRFGRKDQIHVLHKHFVDSLVVF
jgi:hypothetical protein